MKFGPWSRPHYGLWFLPLVLNETNTEVTTFTLNYLVYCAVSAFEAFVEFQFGRRSEDCLRQFIEYFCDIHTSSRHTVPSTRTRANKTRLISYNPNSQTCSTLKIGNPKVIGDHPPNRTQRFENVISVVRGKAVRFRLFSIASTRVLHRDEQLAKRVMPCTPYANVLSYTILNMHGNKSFHVKQHTSQPTKFVTNKGVIIIISR